MNRSLASSDQIHSVAEPPPGLPRYFPQLDGIRGIAVLGVIIQHFWTPGQILFPGAVGVYIFFILSGFLITRILLGCRNDIDIGLTTRGRSIKQFYIRRVLRIFPIYYFYLATMIVLNIGPSRSCWPWFVTYLGNFYIARHGFPVPFGHFWTLAVEEQFYLVWPCVVLWCPRQALRPVCVLAILVGAVSKILIYRLMGNGFNSTILPFSNLDTLACGALLAVVVDRPGRVNFLRQALPWCVLPGVVLIGAGIFACIQGQSLALILTLISAGSCLFGCWLVIHSITSKRGLLVDLFMWKPIRYIGTISYGIYVWHVAMPIPLAFLHRRLHVPEFGQSGEFIAITVLAVIVASVSWRFFERPLNDLKRYFPYLKTTQPQPIECVTTS